MINVFARQPKNPQNQKMFNFTTLLRRNLSLSHNEIKSMSIKGKGKLDLRSGTVRPQDLFLSASTKEVRKRKKREIKAPTCFSPRPLPFSHTTCGPTLELS